MLQTSKVEHLSTYTCTFPGNKVEYDISMKLCLIEIMYIFRDREIENGLTLKLYFLFLEILII